MIIIDDPDPCPFPRGSVLRDIWWKAEDRMIRDRFIKWAYSKVASRLTKDVRVCSMKIPEDDVLKEVRSTPSDPNPDPRT